MQKNMGTADRAIRFLVAAIVVILYLMNVLSGTLGIVLLVVSGIFLLTSFIRFCPLYVLLGISTCSIKK